MKKVLTAAIAAVIAASSLGAASAASAQSRGHNAQVERDYRHDARNDRRDDRRDARQDRRDYRQDARNDRRDFRQDQRSYSRWQQSQRRYNAGRYQAPRGYQVRSWSYGQTMPTYYRTSNYVVNDYGRYGLRAPPRGYHYVRSGNDVVLAAVAGGLITAVIAGLFN